MAESLKTNTPSFVVPFSSVATTQEKRFVIRVKDGEAEWVDVRQGMTVDAGVEIFGNIIVGDTLLEKATDERNLGAVFSGR